MGADRKLREEQNVENKLLYVIRNGMFVLIFISFNLICSAAKLKPRETNKFHKQIGYCKVER